MQISVSYSEPGNQVWLTLEMPDDTNVRSAIEQSGVLKTFPHIDLEKQKVGVFGKLVKLDAPLKPGDRVEIYRGIICDPMTVPRRDSDDEDE
ncbi:MAG: RnfH family protein [Actinomycetota bacterium]